MLRSFVAVAAGMLALTLADSAQAHGPSHAGSGMRSSMNRSGSPSYSTMNRSSYLAQYGKRFSHGYSFSKNNFYYSSRCWSNRYGCYCYWSPYASCWYYWCGAQTCYYPLNYISYAPPTVVVTPTVTVMPGAGMGAGGPGAMPPAGPAVP